MGDLIFNERLTNFSVVRFHYISQHFVKYQLQE